MLITPTNALENCIIALLNKVKDKTIYMQYPILIKDDNTSSIRKYPKPKYIQGITLVDEKLKVILLDQGKTKAKITYKDFDYFVFKDQYQILFQGIQST
jgi:hypothetical protein|nr:MAG TPA: hypothetical protein [Caudoviricetes sp.]